MTPAAATHLLDVGYAVARRGLPSATSFRRWMEVALPTRLRRSAISLRLVDEPEGRALNADFRSKDYATNVLSFPADGARLEDGTRLLGDIAICAPVVAREAAEQGKRPRAHFAHLTVHGVLHLLGYDHIEASDAAAMERKETRLLRELGFPNPYA